MYIHIHMYQYAQSHICAQVFSYFASRARASKCARARAYICIDLDKSPLKTYINVNCRVETK